MKDVPISSSSGFLRRLSLPGARGCVEGLVGPKGLFFGIFSTFGSCLHKKTWKCLELLVVQSVQCQFMFLHVTKLQGNVQLAKEAVAKSGRRNVQETPLHVRVLSSGSLLEAAMDGNVSKVKKLLAKGSYMNAKNFDGKTPLHYAAEHGHLDVVQELVAKGAEVNAKNFDGKTPLDLAASEGHEDVVQALKGQPVIKLLQHAKKSKESSEALKILSDVLQVRCLPEVAQWAVNNSYAIDDFPGDASTARSCVLQYMSFEARARLAAESWQSYVFPGAGVTIAAVSVYMELLRLGSVVRSDETHKFDRGARLLVAKATIKWYWPKMAFRFFEVITIVAFFMGFAMVELWWVLWLPLVGLVFLLLPAIALYGSKEVGVTQAPWL